jgi:hypothetical protein
MMRVVLKGAPAGATLAISLIVLTPLCGWLFVCGCAWPWSGFFFGCNYFDPASTQRCPWCALPLAGVFPVIFAVFVSWAGVSASSGPKRSDYLIRIGAGMWVFLCAALLSGWLAAHHRHYPFGPVGAEEAVAKALP